MVAQPGPRINVGLGWRDERLAVDRRRSTESLTLGLSDGSPLQAWLGHGLILPGGIGAHESCEGGGHINSGIGGEVLAGLEHHDLNIWVFRQTIGNDEAGSTAADDDVVRRK